MGGRLFATEDVSTAEAGSAKETVNSMKAAASFSFSAWGAAEASISASHEQRFPRSSSSATSSSMQTLTWQANGGNTLLANRFVRDIEVLKMKIYSQRLVLGNGHQRSHIIGIGESPRLPSPLHAPKACHLTSLVARRRLSAD